MSKTWTNGDTIILFSRKHCAKKEKLLITSNFSFSHNVFNTCLLLMRQNEYLWSKGLNFSSAFGFNFGQPKITINQFQKKNDDRHWANITGSRYQIKF